MREYTGISRSLNIPHKEAGENNPVWGQLLLALSTSFDPKAQLYEEYFQRKDFHLLSEERVRSGCFACSRPTQEGLLRIHFSNHDETAWGPLSKRRVHIRELELKEMFTEVKKRWPGAWTVAGFSWLYNYPPYQRLFPGPYIRSAIPREWYKSLAKWGQFLDSDAQLREGMARDFRTRISAASQWDDLKRAFLYETLEVRGHIADFYELYEVS